MTKYVSLLAGGILSCALTESTIAADLMSDVGFWPIGALSEVEFSSHANAISGDGRTVVGQSIKNGITEAIVWSEQTGIISLGALGGNTITRATDVSYDGQVVVGAGYSSLGSSRTVFRWTPEGGLSELSGCGCENSKAGAAVSADGRTVISTRGSVGFIWTAETGPMDIVDFPGGSTESNPIDLTSDGSIVVGGGFTQDGARGYRWTKAGGLVELGELMYSAYAVSADGSAIAGVGFQDGQGAVRWTQDEGPVWLGHLPNLSGRPASFASDISADGSVIVGGSGGDFKFSAFRWTQESGMRSVDSLLQALGVDLAGWQLGTANAISADGRLIVGTGINPDGNSEGWIAAIPPAFVPEPSGVTLVLVSLSIFATRRRR